MSIIQVLIYAEVIYLDVLTDSRWQRVGLHNLKTVVPYDLIR